MNVVCKSAKKRKMCIAIGIFVALICIANLENLSCLTESFAKFEQLGLSDNGRYNIWEDYIYKGNESTMNLFWGGPIGEVPRLERFAGNLHNSFLSIHACNGIILLGVVLLIIAKRIIRGIKDRSWVYLGCFLVIIVRGFTDQMLWGTSITPIFSYYLLYQGNMYNRTCGKVMN